MSRLEQLQKFLEQDPNDSFTRYAIGLELASMKSYDKAIEQFEALRTADPAYVATYYQLARAYREAKNNVKAEEIYNAGIAIARKANDFHAASELQAAMEEMEDEE